MKTYEYEGFDKDKQPDKGTVEAPSGEEAILYLLQSGIYPTSLLELSAGQARSNVKLNNLRRFRDRLNRPLAKAPVEIKPMEPKEPIKVSLAKFAILVAGIMTLLYFLVRFIIQCRI